MSDCDCASIPFPAVREDGRQPGDVPVETLFAPGLRQGVVTGRRYERAQFMGQIIYVDPRDAEAMRGLFRRVHLMEHLVASRQDVLQAAGVL